MRRTILAAAAVALLATVVARATSPNDETKRWWEHVQALANDGMRGRDTGSEEHKRAAAYVARQFAAAGLQPAGENGGYFQTVPLQVLRLVPAQSSVLVARGGRTHRLAWLDDLAVAPATGLPDAVQGDLVFAGSDNAAGLDTRGKVVVRLNPDRLVAGPPSPTPPVGIAAIVGIDSGTGPEPARWPAQYAVAMAPADVSLPALRGAPEFRLNPASADVLLEHSGHTYAELRGLLTSGKPVPSFSLGGSMRIAMRFEKGALESQNVLGVLPGSDPMLSPETLVLSAHLDGYGVGAPWKGDRIYNGAFDDAAYVATLLDLAERVRESGMKMRRSLLFAVVTGEEKGLLGSRYFVQHPTVARGRLIADINLDQLRPIFPLRTLTTLAVDDSTLGDMARRVAATMDIRLQPDPEPLRNLLRRSDHWNFIQIGVPAVGFIFGYDKGSPDEVVYRRWYADRYHTPLDDLNQPWDPTAAAKFNAFFGTLVEAVANADERPQWKPGRPAPQP